MKSRHPTGLTARVCAGALCIAMSINLAIAEDSSPIRIGLVTQTNSNAFFVAMKKGAEQKAKELGAELKTYAGRFDGDNDTQVSAVEDLISAGVSGILITPNDPKGIAPALERARKAGILVIALDHATDPANAADATFATDNVKAGELIGQWAAKSVKDPNTSKIAFLDAIKTQPTADLARDIGFMKGFGVNVKDSKNYLNNNDTRIVGHYWAQGSEEGGRTGMEQLLQKEPSLNVVYTINEPTAAGAYEALKAAGKDRTVILTSVDGGCSGVKNVQAGAIGATAMQFPLLMASKGVEAVVQFKKTGKKPQPTPGLSFYDTGVQLVTDKPVTGIPSITSKEALAKCWG